MNVTDTVVKTEQVSKAIGGFGEGISSVGLWFSNLSGFEKILFLGLIILAVVFIKLLMTEQ
jgi:hypothetical protein